MRHAGKMLFDGVPMTSATFAVSKLQYHENRARLWGGGGYGGGRRRNRSFPPAVRSWNNSLLIICIIWAEIDTVRNKIIEIIIRRKVEHNVRNLSAK